MIRHCTMRDLSALTEAAFLLNNQPEHNCNYCCKTRPSIAEDFAAMLENEDCLLIADFDGDRLLSFCGFFVDGPKHRADCVGPFVAEGDFSAAAKALLDTASEWAGPGFTYSMCFDKRNTAYFDFARQMNAVDNGNECIMELARADFAPKALPYPARAIEERDFPAFCALHEENFPNIYVSSIDILESLGKNRFVEVFELDGVLSAYGVLEKPAVGDRMTAEIVCVDRRFRGRGVGRAVVQTLCTAAFAFPGTEWVDLVVDNINERARKLYTSVGFCVRVENCSFSLER